MVLSRYSRRASQLLLIAATFCLGDVRHTNRLNKGGGKGAVPSPKPLPAAPDPNADQAAKQAAADARANDMRRSRSLASSAGDTSLAPTAAPGLKSTLGGGTSPS